VGEKELGGRREETRHAGENCGKVKGKYNGQKRRAPSLSQNGKEKKKCATDCLKEGKG